MNKKIYYIVVILIFLVVFIWKFSNDKEKKDDFPEKVKVALREVGHQLLLVNKDSISLVLPITAKEDSNFVLKFQNQVSFKPGDLVAITKSSFKNANLPENYRVEVIGCEDHQVAYSYEMMITGQKSIIPCRGRILPLNCYLIQVQFTNRKTNEVKPLFSYILFILIFAFLLYLLFNSKKEIKNTMQKENLKIDETYSSIGSFRFYPEQNKLVKEAQEISLSKKECELLTIFLEKPNQIIKREVLSKRVWEDYGVVVGRSLDTYISKLRKKLQGDEAIKITNVHGVGYRLEIKFNTL
ncbi:MAG: winged helix-turn-helix domain-containing protein [Flavobacteriales bacterium]